MSESKRRILVVLVDRANYGRMRPVMMAIRDRPDLDLQVVCGGSMMLERFGSTYREVEADGFTVDGRVFMELEGSIPLSMAKSVGFGVIEFSSEYARLQPEIVLLIGDRYEALGAALAAAYMNIPIAHIQGGEVTGSIDESARHAITKFAHWHFPSTDRAAEYIIRMGEHESRVFNIGCPVGDAILNLEPGIPDDIFTRGTGADIDPQKPFNLVICHPVTTEFGDERRQVDELLDALNALAQPTVFLWPNIDAGADHISKALRSFRDREQPDWLRYVINLSPENFQKALRGCQVAIGNSSSFVRDSTFSGTPVVLVGDRQEGRETGHNLIAVPAEKAAIEDAVRKQLAHGRYTPDTLYGDGNASERIAQHLTGLDVFVQKRLSYIEDEG